AHLHDGAELPALREVGGDEVAGGGDGRSMLPGGALPGGLGEEGGHPKDDLPRVLRHTGAHRGSGGNGGLLPVSSVHATWQVLRMDGTYWAIVPQNWQICYIYFADSAQNS